MDQSTYRNLLFDFFEGRATSLQIKLIEEWLTDPANEAIYYTCLDEWESEHPQYVPNTHEALEQYLTLLNSPVQEQTILAESEVSETPPSRWYSLRWSIAASLLLLMGLSTYFFQKPIFYHIYQTSNAQTRALRFADGTRVVLNANSTLYVPRFPFNPAQREVILEGEAEFKVTHTVDHQKFVVKTVDDFNVVVLGTEFVVFARNRGKKVVLNEGKVRVNCQKNQHYTLHPGDVLTLNAHDSVPLLSRTTKPQLHNAWKNHRFYFDNTPLTEVVQMIEEHFGLDVVVADSTLHQRHLSGYFQANNSKEIIDVLSTLFDLPIERQGNQMIIQPANAN